MIKLEGTIFTVSDGPERDVNDPRNAELLEPPDFLEVSSWLKTWEIYDSPD